MGIREADTNFGISLGIGTMALWVHGGDALRSLRYPSLVEQLEAKLDAEPTFWQDLIKRNFLDNAHRVTVTGVPDPDYEKKLEETEEAKVKAIESTLDDAGKEKLLEDAKRLKVREIIISPS